MEPIESETAEARFDREIRSATRATGISAGAIATFAYPAWMLFDYLVEPATADQLVGLRIGFAIPIGLLWLGLKFTRAGSEHPERFVLGLFFLVELGIALMIPQVDTHYASYALGMSLAIYAGAFLLIWPPRYMAAVIGFGLGSVALALWLLGPVPTDAVATVLFYLATASLVSYVGQYHRYRTAQREFESLLALEREQDRNARLLDELNRLSREDSLTHVGNRRAWDEALARQAARSIRDRSEFAILLCDVDQLKRINDRGGHAAGDLALRNVADILDQHARAADFVARVGGDEFAVLMPGGDLEGACALAERLRAATKEAGESTLSVGAAEWDPEGDSADAIMRRADGCLYRAKQMRDAVSL